MRGDWDIRAAKRIRSRLKAWQADLVHAHDARSHALAIGALVGISSTPLVVTRRVPFTPRSVRLKYGDRVARFIAISEAVRQAMLDGGIDPRRIDVVHSGIVIPRAPVAPRDWRTELGWPPNTVISGVVGAMTREKGIDQLEKIAAALQPRARAVSGIVLLGGTATGDLKIGGIRAFSAGFVDEIEPAVAGLDVLWHPSRAEGLGTAVLDAMAMGVPPVAFGVGGLAEVIVHGESGILVPPGDASAFADAASALITDPRQREALGAGARRRAQTFDASEMTKGTEAVYQRVLAG
jgi:glycosyltransferase involved in cell wall biosynthesis